MIVFISNFLNHHQFPVADAMYRQTNGEYRFIETIETFGWISKSGYPKYDNIPWLVRAWTSPEKLAEAERLVVESDVVMTNGTDYLHWIKRRLDEGRLTFDVGERWLKRGLLNLLSPRLLKFQYYYHRYFYNKPIYRLNCSGFAAEDMIFMRSFKERMFRWGYFPAVSGVPIDDILSQRKNRFVRIISIARFIPLKHHEHQIELAVRLKNKGMRFSIDMYGSGPEEKKIAAMISKFGLEDYVRLCGNLPNDKLMEELRAHDIMIFTSDRNEGWGAVVNEAMGNGCTLVVSSAIGAVPYLVKDGENGMVYNDGDINDLTDKAQLLIEDKALSQKLARAAYKTITEDWSAEVAASNFIKLVKGINQGNRNIIKEGPCSWDV